MLFIVSVIDGSLSPENIDNNLVLLLLLATSSIIFSVSFAFSVIGLNSLIFSSEVVNK